MQLLTALTQKGYQLGYQGVSEGSTVAKSSSLAGLTSSILRQDLQTARQLSLSHTHLGGPGRRGKHHFYLPTQEV